MVVNFMDNSDTIIKSFEILDEELSYNLNSDVTNKLTGYLSLTNIPLLYVEFIDLIKKIKDQTIVYIKIVSTNNEVIIIPVKYLMSISYNYSPINKSLNSDILVSDTELENYINFVQSKIQ
jgi:hypothetical protein